MGIFEEMGFCDNLDFLSGPPGEMKVSQELEPVGQVDEDYSDEEMDVDELEKRMWRDRMRLKRLKEQKKTKDRIDDSAKQRQSQERARRKKMSRAQDGILNGWMDGELTQQQHCPQFGSPAAAALPAIAAACRRQHRPPPPPSVDSTAAAEHCPQFGSPAAAALPAIAAASRRQHRPPPPPSVDSTAALRRSRRFSKFCRRRKK